VALAAAVAVGFLRLPLWSVIAGLGVVSCALAWWRLGAPKP
jgi:hypothetical protein